MIQSILCRFVLVALLTVSALPARAQAAGQKYWVYVGTATGRGSASKGIYLLQLDTATGAIENRGLAAETASPTFLAVDRPMNRLVAVNESAKSVSSFRLDRKTGQLTFVNSQPSGGTTPVHLSVDNPGSNVLVANYSSGTIEVIPMDADGTLRPPTTMIQHTGRGGTPQRPSSPRAHGIYPDVSGKYALVPDLGLDKVFIYSLDSTKGTLAQDNVPFGAVPAGHGPRQLAFSRDNRFVYCINELGNSVTVFGWSPETPALTALQTLSTLPSDFTNRSTAAQIVLHPNGKFLYASNRGHDSIAIFAVDAKTGLLTAQGHVPTGGKVPRNINIDPTGHWLLAGHQNTALVATFKVDGETGQLTPLDQKIEIAAAICVIFVPVE